MFSKRSSHLAINLTCFNTSAELIAKKIERIICMIDKKTLYGKYMSVLLNI